MILSLSLLVKHLSAHSAVAACTDLQVACMGCPNKMSTHVVKKGYLIPLGHTDDKIEQFVVKLYTDLFVKWSSLLLVTWA
ncbi:hypothetical protein BC830DRAFT_1135084 [Chytriomyces sp. MP71]|nr:hypothetical protein BC830DRAFT_1135084 [Chytriomyces sp. MP71]